MGALGIFIADTLGLIVKLAVCFLFFDGSKQVAVFEQCSGKITVIFYVCAASLIKHQDTFVEFFSDKAPIIAT